MRKNLPANAGDTGDMGSVKEWLPTFVCLPGEFYEWMSLVGYSPWGSQRVGYDLAAKTTTKQQQGTKILHAMWHDQKNKN